MLKSRAVKFMSIPLLSGIAVIGVASVSFADTTNTYTVKPGDTLSGIAANYGDTWQELQAVNNLPNPDEIYPGETLQIPGNFSSSVHSSPIVSQSNNAAAPSSSVNWDAVAQCESSGNWAADTGNGFYGGLQFTESTWLAYGGGQYAQNPADASQAAQETVANAVLAGQGIGAWPVCGQRG